jgi:hypothetical protein
MDLDIAYKQKQFTGLHKALFVGLFLNGLSPTN